MGAEESEALKRQRAGGDTLQDTMAELDRLEEGLGKYRTYFMDVLNSIADPICIKDRSHRWVLVNDAFCTLAGQERKALIGRSDYHYFPRHEADTFWEKDEEVFLTGKENINEETITDSCGVTRNLVTKKTLLRDPDGREFIVAIGRDVTEQKRVERALRENEQLLRQVIDTTPAHIFVKDREGRFLLANRKAAETHGITPEEMEGKLETDMAGTNRERQWQIYQFLAHDREIIERQEPQNFFEEALTLPDGSVQWLETIKVPITLKGRRDYVLGVAVDVTARKRAESELREKEELLRQSQKMEAVGRLAGGVAHDFNNILTAVIGYAEMLKRNPSLDATALHGIEEIRKSADRAAELTRQLLAFSRKQVMQPKVLDLNRLIGETETLLRRLIGENVELVTRLENRSIFVRADPGQIEQVIVNLVVNARDSMPQGGKITITTHSVSLGRNSESDDPDLKSGSYARLTLRDTGHGFDEDTKERIFEPFFTTKEKGKGTGLGLSTVYGILKQSGGTIQVESEVGAGTAFQVYLPEVDESSLSPAEIPKPAPPEGRSETLLIVEDEDMVREMMCEVLKSYGYRVLEASNGVEALERWREAGEGGFQLLITDVVMPGMSGQELVRRVRSFSPDLQVLLISGYTEGTLTPQPGVDGGFRFLQKPFTPQTLAEQVHDILARR
jgi:two-component system cell cycle sensor histidine kinase/response regulator CckA